MSRCRLTSSKNSARTPTCTDESLGADNTFGHQIVARADGHDPPQRGSRVRLQPQPGHLHFFAVDGRRLP